MNVSKKEFVIFLATEPIDQDGLDLLANNIDDDNLWEINEYIDNFKNHEDELIEDFDALHRNHALLINKLITERKFDMNIIKSAVLKDDSFCNEYVVNELYKLGYMFTINDLENIIYVHDRFKKFGAILNKSIYIEFTKILAKADHTMCNSLLSFLFCYMWCYSGKGYDNIFNPSYIDLFQCLIDRCDFKSSNLVKLFLTVVDYFYEEIEISKYTDTAFIDKIKILMHNHAIKTNYSCSILQSINPTGSKISHDLKKNMLWDMSPQMVYDYFSYISGQSESSHNASQSTQ